MNSNLYNTTYASKYISRTLKSPYTNYKNALVAKAAKDLKTEVVYDFGCNINGLLCFPSSLRYLLEKEGIDYFGVDIVPEYFSKEFAIKSGVKPEYIYNEINYKISSIDNTNFKSNSIELICSNDVIEHINDPLTALKEIYRLLKKNGHAIFVIPSLYKLDALRLPAIDSKRKSTHVNKMTIIDWSKILVEAGFTIENVRALPVGILSGLLYLYWLDSSFVPTRDKASSEDIKTLKNKLFDIVKFRLAYFDQIFDKEIMDKGEDRKLFEYFINNDIKALQTFMKKKLLSNFHFLTLFLLCVMDLLFKPRF